MIIAAYSNDIIGLVTPISNFTPISLIDEQYEDYKVINKISKKEYLESPLPNDSCIYIKKEVFLSVQFDGKSERFLLDFYRNVIEEGWKLAFDDSTFVKFTPTSIVHDFTDNFNSSNPYNLNNQVDNKFLNSKAFNKSYQNITNYFENNIKTKRKNFLYVFHHGGAWNTQLKIF